MQLGKNWKLVLGVVVVLTIGFGLGLTRVEFATGQDSYLNPDSQIAIDNVAFQDDFGGETIVLLFSGQDGARIQDLFDGANRDELERLNTELAAVEGVYSVVTPLTSLTWSSELVGGPTGQAALLGALSRDAEGADVRNADVQISLARRGAIGPEDQWFIGNPAWNELLIYDNSGFAIGDDGEIVAPPPDELNVRQSLEGTFPNVEGGPINATAVGGIVLDGNQSLDELQSATDAAVAILDTARFDGFDMTPAGSPLYLGEINDYLRGGMLTLGLAAVVIMAVVLFLIFSVRWRLLPLLAVLIGVVWAFSILALLGIELSLVTIAGLPILIGLGIDFAI
ncbi:MAG: MMPL family transporter, partial [Actinomycetota bacterium]